jgi:hypothetical protein
MLFSWRNNREISKMVRRIEKVRLKAGRIGGRRRGYASVATTSEFDGLHGGARWCDVEAK